MRIQSRRFTVMAGRFCLRVGLIGGVTVVIILNDASAASLPPERAPYSESAIRLAQASQRPSARPLRLRSGTFLPAGALESNLARARTALTDRNQVHAIVQFGPAPGAAVRRQLSALGVRVLGYLPEDACFVSIPRAVT